MSHYFRIMKSKYKIRLALYENGKFDKWEYGTVQLNVPQKKLDKRQTVLKAFSGTNEWHAGWQLAPFEDARKKNN